MTSGGIAFILNANLRCSPPNFYRNRIGTLKIKNLVIIGVYITYNNGSKQNQEEFESDLALVQELTNKFKANGDQVIPADLYYYQDLDHTFFTHRMQNDGTITQYTIMD